MKGFFGTCWSFKCPHDPFIQISTIFMTQPSRWRVKSPWIHSIDQIDGWSNMIPAISNGEFTVSPIRAIWCNFHAGCHLEISEGLSGWIFSKGIQFVDKLVIDSPGDIIGPCQNGFVRITRFKAALKGNGNFLFFIYTDYIFYGSKIIWFIKKPLT